MERLLLWAALCSNYLLGALSINYCPFGELECFLKGERNKQMPLFFLKKKLKIL
jgi:hypothetical protein